MLAGLPHGHEHLYHTAPTEPGAVASRLNRDSLAALGPPTTASVYLCGPGAFMDDMRAALTGLGLHDDRIHTELFGALPPITPD